MKLQLRKKLRNVNVYTANEKLERNCSAEIEKKGRYGIGVADDSPDG